MFIGHYSTAIAAKAIDPKAPLLLLFIAAQLLDFIFFPLVLLNIEQLSVVPNATAVRILRSTLCPGRTVCWLA